jgi:Zn-dependent peptidase ImmA (M78 family)
MEKKKLRVRPSDFKTELTFNEWAEKLGISTKCDYDKMEIREYLDKRESADFVINNGLTRKDEIKPVNFKPTFNELVATYLEKYL